MKILKLRLRNIHSLKGDHEVNFAEGILSEAGLFAITGPTGSGKSTLLDVITLALYNRIPRINKSLNKNVLEAYGGVMTRNAKDSFAEVEFMVESKSYRANWAIDRARTNKLKTRRHELVDVETGEIIFSGISAPEEIEKIIGLSYDQFVKAMVLSQGEFSKLLKSPRDERNKLLEDITGAGHFRKIGARVFDRYSKSKKAVELQQTRLGEIFLLSEEELSEMTLNHKNLIQKEPVISSSVTELNNLIEIRKDIKKLKEEKEVVKLNHVTHTEKLEKAKPKREQIETHNKRVVYRERITNFKQLNKELRDEDHSLLNTNELISDRKETKKEVTLQIEKLISQNLNTGEEEFQLEEFRKRVESLIQQETKEAGCLNSLVQQSESGISTLKRMGYDVNDIDKPEIFLENLNLAHEKSKSIIEEAIVKNIDEAEFKIREIDLKQEELTAVQIDITTLIGKNKTIEDQKSQYIKSQKELKNIENQITAIKPELKNLKIEFTQLKKEHENALKHKSLEEHRLQLEDGQPCALCGSIKHPYATLKPNLEINENVLKSKESLVEIKSSTLNHYKGKMEAQGVENKKRTERIEHEKIEINKLQKKIDAQLLRHGLKKTTTSLDIDELKKSNKKEIDLLHKAKSAFTSKIQIEEAINIGQKWKTQIDVHQSIQTKRKEIYEGVDINSDANKLSQQFTKSSATLRQLNINLQTQLKTKEKKENLLKQSKEDLDTIIAKEAINSIEELEKSILSENIVQQIRKEISFLDQETVKLKEASKMIAKSLVDKVEKDDESLNQENLENSYLKSSTELKELQQKIGQLNEKIQSDKKSRLNQQQKIIELEKLQKEASLWRKMNDLIGDAQGKRFSNFVQDLTLEQLIGFANKRLKDLTDRYHLDIPTAEEVDKNDSLKIFDLQMGNSRRSVNTLSGGETFMVSLAMALALSDLAAKNVKIESLFIDEGFGTLDPETLDQAITILEKIQNETDKSIGIISHMENVKERITTQIQLKKSGAGFSSLSIQG